MKKLSMKTMSIGTRVSLIVVLMIAVITAVNVIIVMVSSNRIVTDMARSEAVLANNTFAKEMQNLQKEALMSAEIISHSREVAEAILARDGTALRRALAGLNKDVDFITVCDAEGTVLARSHNDQTGDNVINQKLFSSALHSGTGLSTIESSSKAELATSGSAVIRDSGGTIIGAVVCGHNLAKTQYVDEFKRLTHCETTIFAGDTRLSTTLVDERGNRAIGTKASQAVIDIVMTQKKTANE